MTIGILKEPTVESRVSLLPESAATLVAKGFTLLVEQGAGEKAFGSDEAYIQAGAQVRQREETLKGADLVLSINMPQPADIAFLSGKTLIGIFQPLYHPDLMQRLAEAGVTVFSLDMLPRTSRAQSMDVLSSQANIAGYKAVILAAARYSRYFPMLMTAAGSISPAKVLILGAGVAGLQAIATARRLGAVVEVFDTRPAVKEEVMSLGARFVEVEGAADASAAGGYAIEQSSEFQARQRQKIAESIAKADIVITTAQIPGKKAPVLVTAEMIAQMRKGSVIIDLAAASGGNTEYTRNNETVEQQGVSIIGAADLAATLPSDASKLYGKNIMNFLPLITGKDGALNLDFNDELVKGSCIAHDGGIVHERVRELI
ncbi:MAG: Re/Si-specific NAD(P)(+) transhydrogenase subunit alpha [Chitinophagaceae bacterium]|nr:Re/Si-specific NAD(P)(+) transhydrogenase subunit alpha [Chitinophagaceae bacterium]